MSFAALSTTSPVVVFSKTYCPYCVKLKGLLNSLNVKYDLVELDTMKGGDAIQDEMKKATGQSTVPNVIVNGKSIGGCDDTHSLHNKGQLVPLLTEAGAISA